MIPKIIHYCWISDEIIPDKFLNNINSWKEKLPDYKFIKWDKGNQVFFFSSSFELFLFILKIKNFLARFKFYIKL